MRKSTNPKGKGFELSKLLLAELMKTRPVEAFDWLVRITALEEASEAVANSESVSSALNKIMKLIEETTNEHRKAIKL